MKQPLYFLLFGGNFYAKTSLREGKYKNQTPGDSFTYTGILFFLFFQFNL